jgi:putative copper export protein
VPSAPEFAIAALRWLEYVGLLGFIGVVVIRRLSGQRPHIHWAHPSMQPALTAALAGGLGVVGAEALRTGHLTIEGVVRVLAEGIALVMCVAGRRAVVVPVLVAEVALAFSGHAALVNPNGGAIFTDAIHVLSAGAWAGGILVLATLRPPGGWAGAEGRAMLERFGRVALLAFVVTALTGAIRATQAVGDLTDLWATPYGVVLSLKIAGVLVMAATSAVVWRRGWRYARAEGVVVLLVLAATAILAAFPMPPTPQVQL